MPITQLELIDCNIRQIPDAINQLKALEILICIDDSLSVVSHTIGSLRNLKSLVLGTDLDELPKEIGKLENLERLILSGNRFNSVPVEICALHNLVELAFENNKINSNEAFPQCIYQLKSLKSIRLANNPIAEREFNFWELYI